MDNRLRQIFKYKHERQGWKDVRQLGLCWAWLAVLSQSMFFFLSEDSARVHVHLNTLFKDINRISKHNISKSILVAVKTNWDECLWSPSGLLCKSQPMFKECPKWLRKVAIEGNYIIRKSKWKRMENSWCQNCIKKMCNVLIKLVPLKLWHEPTVSECSGVRSELAANKLGNI